MFSFRNCLERGSWLPYSTYLYLDFHLFHDQAKRTQQVNLLGKGGSCSLQKMCIITSKINTFVIWSSVSSSAKAPLVVNWIANSSLVHHNQSIAIHFSALPTKYLCSCLLSHQKKKFSLIFAAENRRIDDYSTLVVQIVVLVDNFCKLPT